MADKQFITVDGIQVELNGEKNLLEVIRKAGIEIPTFCYNPELSAYGACRMCLVENQKGGLDAACHTPPRAGMVIKTNTPKIRNYRKTILELLLASHCRDCTACSKNGNCQLQNLAKQLGVETIRFENSKPKPDVDDSSYSIVKDSNKCILCGQCVRVCNEVQAVGAIDFAKRGSKLVISTSYGIPISESCCVGCGQCAAVCPTGAITVKNDIQKVWKALDDKDTLVTVQVAPAVRVALGEEFGIKEGEDVIGKINAAIRRLGADEVYDTSTSADLTILEEAKELLDKLANGDNKLPLFTSCCPGWIRFAESKYPEILPYISTCRSPMEMFASLLAVKNEDKKHFHIAVMPCTGKKFEAQRPEFSMNGKQNVDAVLTTQELISMIKAAGIKFDTLEPEAPDSPFGSYTGAGVIFGVTGGVTEAALRFVSESKTGSAFREIAYSNIRGMEGVKYAEIPAGEATLKIAVVSGLANAKKLIDSLLAGDIKLDFVEVMACPGGCVNGGGQPTTTDVKLKNVRGEGLYRADSQNCLKTSEANPVMKELYDGILKGRVHELLHTHHVK